MNMVTWNVQGLGPKYIEVFDQLKKSKIDIGTLTETKKKGSGNEECDDYLHFYSGVTKDKRAKCGVSIVVRKAMKDCITSWRAVNERLMTMDMVLRGHKTVIIAAYAPTDDALVELKESYEEELTTLLDSINPRKEIILMGDLNARVGSKEDSKIIGKYGETTCNDNGKRLISICENYELKITNGFFDHKDIHRFTWRQPTKNLKSILDYIILRQNSRLKAQDVRVQRGADCGSDHYMVKAKIVPQFIQNKKPTTREESGKGNKVTTYNIDSFINSSTQFLYKLRLSKNLQINLDQSAEEIYYQLKESLECAAKEALGETYRTRRKPTYWWNDTLEAMISEKAEKYHRWLATQTPQDWQEYAKHNREVKAQVKKAKTDAWEKKCATINAEIGSTRSKEAWKTLKFMRQNVCERANISPITIKQWEQYFRKLLTEDRVGNGPISYAKQDLTENDQIPAVSTEEVIHALQGMKNGKSAGPGGIPIELVKFAPIQVKEILACIFNKCLSGESETPEEWKMATIIPFFKKGDKRNCDNYRGISVTASIGRLYGRVIKNRLEQEITQSEEQSGFRAGRSCIDNIFCLQQLLEKRTARGRETHMVFVDLQKAYDTIPIKKLFDVLETREYSKPLVNAIKTMYHNSRSVVKVGNQISNEIRISKGLRQGCCISPTLFNIYIAEVLYEWSRKCGNMGVHIEESSLHTLLFADDQVVIAEDKDDINYMIRKLTEQFEKWDLTMNTDKTKYMVVGGQGNVTPLDTGDSKIDPCTEFKYLGATITADGSSNKDICNKINMGKRIIGMLNPILWSTQLTLQTKRTINNVIMESIVTYGSETWGMTKYLEKKLTALQMDFFRRSCRVSRLDHITNAEIRHRIGSERSILDTIEQKRLMWYGHVKRMPNDRLPKKLFEWAPANQRRKRGRPRTTWYQGVKAAMEFRELRENDILDREAWRRGTVKHRQMS